MKNKNLLVFSLILSFPVLAQALDFEEDTIFLMANTAAECEALGGSFTEWESETYCTKKDELAAFSDVNRSHAHAEAIAYVKGQGIVSGYEDGTFRPDDTINRVELLKILVEAEYRQTPECRQAFPYTDTMTESWYQRYVQIGSCVGIVGGYPDNTFKPSQEVSITEASKMISEAFAFENNNATDIWYEGYIRNLAYRGALPTTIEALTSDLNRGQMAEIIYRLKTGRTTLATHTLTSLKAGTVGRTPITFEPTVQVETETEFDIDTELDSLFKELSEEGLVNFE